MLVYSSDPVHTFAPENKRRSFILELRNVIMRAYLKKKEIRKISFYKPKFPIPNPSVSIRISVRPKIAFAALSPSTTVHHRFDHRWLPAENCLCIRSQSNRIKTTTHSPPFFLLYTLVLRSNPESRHFIT